MMTNSKISIIVPCYNQAQYLGDALQSILNQTYQNWECIIVNDGSTDDTEAVAQQWCNKDARYSYYFQQNEGVSAARNFGLQMAKCDYIQFLDGDDMLEKDKIYNQVCFLEKEKKVDIVYSSNKYFFSEDKANLFAIHYMGILPTVDISMDDSNQKDVLSIRNVCTICSSLYRRRIFEIIKFKDVVYEDWLFHIECSLHNFNFHFENFSNATSLIRMTPQSQMIKHVSHLKKNDDFHVEHNRLNEKFNFTSKLLLARKKAHVIEVENDFYKLLIIRIRKIVSLFVPPIVYIFYHKIFKYND